MALQECSQLNFRSGISLGKEAAKVIAQVGPRVDPEAPQSTIMEWSRQSGWSSYAIALTARRMWTLTTPREHLVIMGAGGYVTVLAEGRFSEEMVDESKEGPSGRGNIRDMRLIGTHLYAAGMNRQVYRRDGLGRWVHMDRGVVQPRGNLTVSGFSAIDGVSASDIYAVGFNGEIWHYNGDGWESMDSPTNVLLHRVRVAGPDLVFASGQGGVVLTRSRFGWAPIHHDLTNDDLWGMEIFNGRLYLAADNAIYTVENQELKLVETGLGDSFTYRHLHANQGAMWSFGPKHIAMTDGAQWIDVTPTWKGTRV